MAIKSKKGIFFTFMALVIVSVLILIFSSDDYITSKNKIPVIKSRVQTADSYLRSLETSYLKASLYTSSYNALNSIILYINQTGSLNNESVLNATFEEVMLNGSINGKNLTTEYGIKLMEENTFIHRLEDIEEASQDVLHITTSFDKDGINTAIFQSNDTGPWQVGINLTMNYSVYAGYSFNASVARWNKTKTFSVVINILGFDDPLYLANAHYFHAIKEAPFNESEWNFNALEYHIANQTYKKDKNASSFLMRFYNDSSKSLCCGIESMINETLCNSVTDKSYVDYCFWSNECDPGTGYGVNLHNITGITTLTYPFKLDEYHIGQYNVTDKIE